MMFRSLGVVLNTKFKFLYCFEGIVSLVSLIAETVCVDFKENNVKKHRKNAINNLIVFSLIFVNVIS